MNVHLSPLVLLADEARRPSRWWLAWLITMVIIVVVPPLGIALGNAVLGAPASTSAWYPYVGAFGSLATLLAVWLWVRLKEGRTFATVGFRPGRGWLRLLVGFGVGGAMMSGGVVLGLLVGAYRNGQSSHPFTGLDAVLPFLPLILLFLLQAVCQTALTPGYLLQMSIRQMPAWLAIIGTSILLTVLHTLNPVSMLNLFLYATFATLVALQQGSLWLVAGIQGGWACFQSSVFGLPLGGIPAPIALFSIGPVPDVSGLVSGGRFGLETGLLATPVLVLASVVAYLMLRRTTKAAPVLQPAAETPVHSPRKEQPHVNHGD